MGLVLGGIRGWLNVEYKNMRICDLVMYKWWINQSVLLRGPTLQVVVWILSCTTSQTKDMAKMSLKKHFLSVIRSIILLSRRGS